MMTFENFVKGKRLVLQMRVNVNTKGTNITNSQTVLSIVSNDDLL
jgi:hypothetical protein